MKIAVFLDSLKSSQSITICTGVAELVEDFSYDGTPLKIICCATFGQMWRNKLEAKFLVVLQTVIKFDKNGNREYLFRTQSTQKSSAKSPIHLDLEEYIPNDINYVINRLEEKKLT